MAIFLLFLSFLVCVFVCLLYNLIIVNSAGTRSGRPDGLS